MNANRKGKRGEREFAAVLRATGFDARRGRQFAGGPDSPDVVSGALPWLHVEVKRVQRLKIAAACAQAEADAGGKPFIIAHRRNGEPWFITMPAEFFFRLLRGIGNGATGKETPIRYTGSNPERENSCKQRALSKSNVKWQRSVATSSVRCKISRCINCHESRAKFPAATPRI
jgi:Holliday junction resolvase